MRFLPCIIICACLLQAAAGRAQAAVLVAGTNPSTTGFFFVANTPGPEPDVYYYEQLFTLSTAVHATALNINLGSFSSGAKLNIQFFSGLGIEGTGTLLQTFDIQVPQIPGFLQQPNINIPLSLALNAGSYSLLLSLPDVVPYVVYQLAATGENSPFGSLGGMHGPYGAPSPNNIVFDLQGDVQGNGVPEPAVFLPVGLALLVMGLRSAKGAARMSMRSRNS